MSNEYSASQALTLAHDVQTDSGEQFAITDHARALQILACMNIVQNYEYAFTLQCSQELAANLLQGCEHFGTEDCQCSVWHNANGDDNE